MRAQMERTRARKGAGPTKEFLIARRNCKLEARGIDIYPIGLGGLLFSFPSSPSLLRRPPYTSPLQNGWNPAQDF